MKKTTLTILFIITALSATAQDKFTKGIRAGVNLSSIYNVGGETKADFYIGAVGAIKFTRFYTLQPELNYSRQGMNNVPLGRIGDASNSVAEYSDINLNYISITVMNKFNLKKFFLQVGPSFDILTKKSKYSSNNIDLSANFGLGMDVTSKFTIEARYKVGVADLYEQNNYNFFPFDDLNYGSTFQIGGIFKF